LTEYSGPFFIHPTFLLFGSLIFGTQLQYTFRQQLFTALMAIHFGKRLLETVFVHRFSHGTMPLMNIFKNSFHYWILSGLLLAFEIYSPSYTQWSQSVEMKPIEYGWVIVWVWAQLSNLSTHVTLRNLRPPGTKKRGIPRGYGFDTPFNVSCPNYFFETIAWLAVLALTRSWSCTVFVLAAVVQMYAWAVKKHRSYRKEFKDYPSQRRAIFPYLA
jgi:very-long-chain enoyl-CoA reductase